MSSWFQWIILQIMNNTWYHIFKIKRLKLVKKIYYKWLLRAWDIERCNRWRCHNKFVIKIQFKTHHQRKFLSQQLLPIQDSRWMRAHILTTKLLQWCVVSKIKLQDQAKPKKGNSQSIIQTNRSAAVSKLRSKANLKWVIIWEMIQSLIQLKLDLFSLKRHRSSITPHL